MPSTLPFLLQLLLLLYNHFFAGASLTTPQSPHTHPPSNFGKNLDPDLVTWQWPTSASTFSLPVQVGGKHGQYKYIHFFAGIPLAQSVVHFCGAIGECTAEDKSLLLAAAESRVREQFPVAQFDLVSFNAKFAGNRVGIKLDSARSTMDVYGKVVNVAVRFLPEYWKRIGSEKLENVKICHRFVDKASRVDVGSGCVRLDVLQQSQLLAGDLRLESSWVLIQSSLRRLGGFGYEYGVGKRLRLVLPEGVQPHVETELRVELAVGELVESAASFSLVRRSSWNSENGACDTFLKTCRVTSYKAFESCHVENIEQLYEQVFGMKSDGVFVEMGSYDGHSWSNTAFLADIGWQGLYFDPVKEHVLMTEARHWENNVTVFETAVGNQTGEIVLDVGGPITTADDDYSAKYHDGSIDWTAGFFKGDRRSVKQRTLPDLLKMFDIPRTFDLLVVDVEGMEHQILSALDLTEFSPRMAIIELQDDHPSFESLSEKAHECRLIREQFAQNGYVELFRDEVNTVFVLNEETS